MEAAGRSVIVCVYQNCKLICSSRWFFSTVLVGIKTFTWSTSVRYSKTPNSHTDPKPAGCHYCWPMLAFGSFSPHCYKCFSFALFLSFVPAWQSLSRDKTFQTDSDGNQVFKGHRWGCLLFFCDPCVCPRLLLQEKTCVFVPEPKVQSVKGRKVKASVLERTRFGLSSSFCALCRSSACEAVQAGGVITASICAGVFRLHTAGNTELANAGGREAVILASYCNKDVPFCENLVWLWLWL